MCVLRQSCLDLLMCWSTLYDTICLHWYCGAAGGIRVWAVWWLPRNGHWIWVTNFMLNAIPNISFSILVSLIAGPRTSPVALGLPRYCQVRGLIEIRSSLCSQSLVPSKCGLLRVAYLFFKPSIHTDCTMTAHMLGMQSESGNLHVWSLNSN